MASIATTASATLAHQKSGALNALIPAGGAKAEAPARGPSCRGFDLKITGSVMNHDVARRGIVLIARIAAQQLPGDTRAVELAHETIGIFIAPCGADTPKGHHSLRAPRQHGIRTGTARPPILRRDSGDCSTPQESGGSSASFWRRPRRSWRGALRQRPMRRQGVPRRQQARRASRAPLGERTDPPRSALRAPGMRG